MDNDSSVPSTSPSLILASVGWIATGIVAIWFFMFAAPAYRQQGYDQGVADQNAQDKALYETAFGSPTGAQPLVDILNVRVIRVQPGSIVVNPIVFNGTNPFVEETKQQTIVYDSSTRIVRRVPISSDEYERRIEAAVAAGGNPMLLPPFDDLDAKIEDIQPAHRLEVMSRDRTDLTLPSFMADFIAIVVE